MAVTWTIVQLDSTKTVGSLSDVVTAIHWSAIDVENVSGVDHTGYRYGCIALSEADSESFTAYQDITETNAIAWLKDALGDDEVTAIETDIAEQVTESKTPTVSSGVPSAWPS